MLTALKTSLIVCAVMLSAAAMAETVPEPSSYQLSDYRAPTPATVDGQKALTTAEAHDLWANKKAVFVDVLPRPPRPANLVPGTIWRDKPRNDIPGSLWLPDTGYGAISPETEAYFRRGLEQVDRRAERQRDRLLLPAPMLDVVERDEAREEHGLYPCLLVFGRNRRLVRSGLSARIPRASEARLKPSSRARHLHLGLDFARQRKEPLLDRHRHFADITQCLVPILKDAHVPLQLFGGSRDGAVRIVRLFGRCGFILRFVEFFILGADLVGRLFLPVTEAHESLDHFGALAVEPVE